jgi:NUMOD3 motif
MNIYCTYLTSYFGNKLPLFYIGSTSVEKILKGYRGSVSSKKYKQIWKKELKENPHLFKTKIISKHQTKKEAMLKEQFFHKQLKVNVSPLYTNKAIASPNGCFGVVHKGKDSSMYGRKGKLSPRYGINHTFETKKILSEKAKGRIVSEETRKKLSIISKRSVGKKMPDSMKLKMSVIHKGKSISEEQKQLISKKLKGKKRGSISAELSKKLSELRKGKPGHPTSDEAKRKIAESKLGKKWYYDPESQISKLLYPKDAPNRWLSGRKNKK